MAKKTTAKKPKRRLKRTARRSLAVVLMITAVVVAAIPVPENMASVSTGSRAAGDSFGYVVADPDEDYVANEGGEHDYIDNTVTNGTPDADLMAALETVAPATEPALRSAINLIEVDGEKILMWEFLYQKNGVLCKYNNRFPRPEATVGLMLKKNYHTVLMSDYDNYFKDPAKYQDTKNPMFNLDPDGDLYPTKKITYTCKQVIDDQTRDDTKDISKKEIDFLKEYFTDEFDTFEKSCKEWDAAHAAWEIKKKQYENAHKEWQDRKDNDPNFNLATDPEPVFTDEEPLLLKDTLEKTPSVDLQNNPELKRKFYLEQHQYFDPENYEMVEVLDYRLADKRSIAEGNPIYVLKKKAGSTIEAPSEIDGVVYRFDDDGYVVEKDTPMIGTIGAKAFANIKNVGKITFTETLTTIGDSAFENSGITEVYFGNEAKIGNRSFAECTQLTRVDFGGAAGSFEIGAEAFRGCSSLGTIAFPYSVELIGHGAFSNCVGLTSVDLSQVTANCNLEDYAFFNDTALLNVNFGGTASKVVGMGEGCFAVAMPSTGLPLTTFTYPENLTGKKTETSNRGLGDYTLANRQSLDKVTMPKNYADEVPVNTFYHCTEMSEVIFPAESAKAFFGTGMDTGDDNDLFKYVTNEKFQVRGPELDGDGPAGPRRSTWYAYTQVSGENGVPYVYTDRQGRECYEVAMKSDDGGLYRYEANQDGELLSCVLIRGRGNVDIVIPSQIGTISIKSIGGDCFSDSTLRSKIKSITVRDDSISTIAAEAFQNLSSLEKVRIGNSVTEIGARAFANCRVLEDVFFTKPAGGYNSLNMDPTAFATEGAKLTFHGDIVVGYGPFEWATDKERLLRKEGDDNSPAVNVCYQSLWDSENGTHLTVMVDRGSSADNKEVVLLDYPKMSDLIDGLEQDEELKDYCRDMEQYYYYSVYNNGATTVNSKGGKSVDQLRSEYSQRWANGDSIEALEDIYGPWINPMYCESWDSYLTTASADSTADSASEGVMAGVADDLYHALFDPIVAEAVSVDPVRENPTPYFEKHPYSFVENYLNMQANNPTGDGLEDYQMVPARAQGFINATETIIVPEGVTSIDVNKYAAEKGVNWDNYDMYIRRTNADADARNRTGKAGGAVPGLFSGRYKDYDHDDPTKRDEKETNVNGNDLIKRVELNSVKELPAYAFDSCEQLLYVKLGAVENIGKLPFRGCGKMTTVEGNSKYPVEKGIIFEKMAGEDDGKYKIIECLMTKGDHTTNVEGLADPNVDMGTSTMMAGVTEIEDHAFDGCDSIATVDLSGAVNLKEIPEGCFENCTSLASVALSSAVNKIKENAFGGKEENYPMSVTVRGREVDIADNAFSPKKNVTLISYDDSAAHRYADRYYNEGMRFAELGAYRVIFYDYDGKQIGATQELEKRGNDPLYARAPEEAKALAVDGYRPGYKFTGWIGYDSKGNQLTLESEITEDLTTFVAQYQSDGTMVGGQFVVEFYDGVDGSLMPGTNNSPNGDGKYYVDAGMNFTEAGLRPPTHKSQAGYEPMGYSENWTVETVIDKNMSIILLYKAAPTSSGTTSSGTTSGNSGNNNNNSSRNSSSNNSSSSSSSSSSSTSSSSTSATSTTSGAGQYTVFVEGGSGSGSYTPGTTVIISASVPAEGMRFDKWTTDSNGVSLASVSMTSTTFTMPSNNVTVKANFVEAPAAPAVAVNTNGGTGNNTATGGNGNGNTQVDIEKPGISNRDLATANTNGSSDNFVVKISETDEATRAVAAALTNKYGTLDNILYYAMDISLYDSTGTTKITDTTGLSVDITIPIPDSLVAYGGNNMAGAVINGDQLESLNENFTTINGVPCVRFRATHFSPYTIYVDTGNLVEGELDVTPKTGDPIHPKWFLSLGLACLSVILFMKRDKKVAVKA